MNNGCLAVVTLNRPEQLNALNLAALYALAEAFQSVPQSQHDREVREKRCFINYSSETF